MITRMVVAAALTCAGIIAFVMAPSEGGERAEEDSLVVTPVLREGAAAPTVPAPPAVAYATSSLELPPTVSEREARLERERAELLVMVNDMIAVNETLQQRLAVAERKLEAYSTLRFKVFRSDLEATLQRDFGTDALTVRVGNESIDVSVDVRDVLMEVARHLRIADVDELRRTAVPDGRVHALVDVLRQFYATMLLDDRMDWAWREQRIEALFGLPDLY